MNTFIFHIEKLDSTDLGCEYVKAYSRQEAFEKIKRKYPYHIINDGHQID